MTSYIGKAIVFFTVIYTLLIPSTLMNAFAEGSITHGKTAKFQIDNVGTQVSESSKKNSPLNDNKKDERQKTDNTPDYGKADAIGRNIQTAGQILSSSPSELAEQAKSYALGKINNTIASEAQKWLSQSSTAKINFGFDRKGSLENNSIDLLVPLYDNKADWFFFSQLGYRNKDSRNTVNFGLGGRYFNQDWMYGLNTFYDYDITGQNRRVGLGGELWGDYIKFSANGYHRLSDWQMSRNFEEHHERPANGYDINGEFFLSAYPNLGGKLSYGQYFGENVTLFNRQTKQRNPSQTKIGVTYTPIPLVTMGVDYKQGSGGQSETQFLTNFNLRLGVPLNTQLSPDNVASMRTLAGSRYDLVERENHIVLDHREIPKSELSVPERVVGYSHELQDISKEISANASIKQINIADGNAKKEFISSGGDIYLDSGRVYIKFPEYSLRKSEINNYPLYISAELTNNQKTKPKQMQVIVRPFEIQYKEGSPPNFTPEGPLPASGDKGFTFDPIITFDAPANPNVVKNATIDNVEWFAIPVEKSASPTRNDNVCKTQENTEKLAFTPNKEFKQIKIMDDGHIAVSDRVTLMSKGYAGSVAVCVAMDGQPKKFVGEVVFYKESSGITLSHTPPDSSIIVNENYTFTVKTAEEGKIPTFDWSFEAKYKDKVMFSPNNDTAILTSSVAQKVKVTVTLDDGVSKSSDVEFKWPTLPTLPTLQSMKLVPDSGSLPLGGEYDITATILDLNGNPYTDSEPKFEWSLSSDPQEADLSLIDSVGSSLIGKEVEPNSKGELIAKLGSKDKTPSNTVATVCLKIVETPELNEEQKKHQCVEKIKFKTPPVDFEIVSVEVYGTYDDKGNLTEPYNPDNKLIADGKSAYAYRAKIEYKNQKNKPVTNHKFNFGDKGWSRNHKEIKVDLGYPEEDPKHKDKYNTTDEEGYLYSILKSHNAGVEGVNVALTIPDELDEKIQSKESEPVAFKAKKQDAVLFVYNDYKGMNKVFYKSPYNFFISLNIELRAEPDKPFERSKLEYSTEKENSDFVPFISLGKDKKGPIKIEAQGSVTLVAEIKEDDGRYYEYKYDVNIERFVIPPANSPVNNSYGYHTVGDGVTCETFNEKEEIEIGSDITLFVDEVDRSAGNNALGSEFSNIYDWGFFHFQGSQADSKNLQYKLKDKKKGYLIFNPDGPSNNSSGLLLCKKYDGKKDK